LERRRDQDYHAGAMAWGMVLLIEDDDDLR